MSRVNIFFCKIQLTTDYPLLNIHLQKKKMIYKFRDRDHEPPPKKDVFFALVNKNQWYIFREPWKIGWKVTISHRPSVHIQYIPFY